MKGVILQAVDISAILSSVGSFLTAAVGWMGDVIAFVSSEPILLLMVVLMPVGGFAIGGLRRLIRL